MADRKKDYHAVMATPCGMLGIVADDAVARVDFLSPRTVPYRARTPLARETLRQLDAYFRDPDWQFDLPLTPAGTPFQQRVWRAMRRIPPGAVASYGDLARRLDSGARAVGGACGANPLPIIVPCHRVVAAAGLGGYSGGWRNNGQEIKQWLLRHEGA